MLLRRQNSVEFSLENTSKTVLRRFASYRGEAYNHLSFAFENLRGCVLDPLYFFILRCIQWAERTRGPTKPLEDKLRKELPSGCHDEAYSLHLSELSLFDNFESNEGVPVHCFDEWIRFRELDETASSGTSRVADIITGCGFSFDGRRFATCYESGNAIVWDAVHGSVVAATIMPLRSKILAISFSSYTNSILQIVTQDWNYYKWEFEDHSLHKEDISSFWRKPEHEDKHVDLHTADFFDNGSIVVCSLIRKSPSRATIDFFVSYFDSYFVGLGKSNSSELTVKKGSIVSGVEISPDGKGLLVGTLDSSSRKGQCFLWPSFRENSAYHVLSYGGMLGNWSTNNDLAVTWTIPNGLNQEDDDDDSCAFVWNVTELRINMGNGQRSADDPTVLRNPFGDRVLWCRLVLDAKGKDRLIMAIVNTTTRFLFWDVHSKTHTHTIETGIETKDMMLESAGASMDSVVHKKSVRGLSSMALTMDRSKFGAVLGKPSRLLIWDVTMGVQSLKLSPPQSQEDDFESVAEIIFSPTSGKIAMVGEHSATVFAPPTPFACPSVNGRTMESPMIEIDALKGKESIDTEWKLSFSGDGNTLGVLPIGLNEMHVHHFSNNATCTIETDPMNYDGIVDFCVSMDGKYVVTNTTRAKIYVWRCTGEVGEHMGEIGEGLETMALGITRDGKEIVVCSNKGDLVWFATTNGDESQSNEGSIHESVFQKGKFFSSSFARTRSPLLDDYHIPLLESEQPFALRGDVDSIGRHQEPSSFNRVHTAKIGGYEVLSCRISASCEKGVRLLNNGLLENWNLSKRKRGTSVTIAIPLLWHSLTQDLLPLYGPRQFFDIRIIERDCLEGNDVSFPDKRRVIVAERDGFLVVADITSSTTKLQGPSVADGSSHLEQHIQGDVNSIFIIDSRRHRRQLKGKDLHPQKGLAISADGRHVACLSGNPPSKVTVWSVYACQDLLLDHHSLSLLYDIKSKSMIKEKCQGYLESMGSNFYTFQHPNGRTLLIDGVLSLNKPLIRFIIKDAINNAIKVSLLLSTGSQNGGGSSMYHNAIEVSLHKRSLEIVKTIMSYLLERVTHEAELECILNHSLIDLHNVYPHIFQRLITKNVLFNTAHEIEVPETILDGRTFATSTSNSLNLTEKETKEFWKKSLETEFAESTDSSVPTVPAKAMTLPYKDACNPACEGLLHDLVTNRAHYNAFGSLVTRAIVNFKWRNHAKRLMIQEALYYLILLSSYMVYCFMLCTDGMYKVESHQGKEENSNATKYSLLACWLLAFPCFIRTIHQCVIYLWSYGVRGIFCWLGSAWNCVEAVSYLNLVIVLPLAEWFLLREGSRSTSLSSIAAVECLLLWSRVLYYARCNRRVGMFVTVMSSVVTAVIPFLFVVLCVVLGFAVAFHVLYRHVGHTDGDTQVNEDIDYQSLDQSFGTFGRTLFTVFGFMFGDFELGDIYHAPNGATAIIFFVLYMVIVATTLLNMLIAVMSTMFSGIRNRERVRFVKARAAAIGDVESRMSYKMKQKINGTIGSYLHVIIPKFGNETVTKHPRPTSKSAGRGPTPKTEKESRLSSWIAAQERDYVTQRGMHQDSDNLSSKDESIHQYSVPDSMVSR